MTVKLNIKYDTVSLLDDSTYAQLIIDYSIGSKKLSWQTDTFSITGT